MYLKLKQVDSIPNFFINEESGIFYVKKMVNGRVVWKSTKHTNRKRAFKRYNEIMSILADKRSGWDDEKVPTLREWWNKYQGSVKKSPKTMKREDSIMQLHWLPQFGTTELGDIKPSDMGRALNWRRKKAKQSTVTREQSLLHALFEAAIDDELIEKNPLRKIARIPYKTRTQVVSEEDQDKLLAIAPPTFGRWVQFVLGTGLRFAEAQILLPADIDWEGRSIHVIGKGHNGEPKERWVPLLSPVLETILKQQIEDNESSSSQHRMDRKGKLWPQSYGYWHNELARLCKRAGIPFFAPHILRHSFATRYLQAGGDIYILSRILGHASVKMTEKVYAHLLKQDDARLSKHVDLKLLPAIKGA